MGSIWDRGLSHYLEKSTPNTELTTESWSLRVSDAFLPLPHYLSHMSWNCLSQGRTDL